MTTTTATLEQRAQTQPFAHFRVFNRQCLALDMLQSRDFETLYSYVFPDGQPLRSYLPAID